MTNFSFEPGLESYLIAFGIPLAIALSLTYIVYYINEVIRLSAINCAIDGAKGVLYAIVGMESYKILRERVIEVSENDAGYKAVTTDGEQNYRYQIIVSKEDIGNPDYDINVRLAGSSPMLQGVLIPRSRVKRYFYAEDKFTKERIEFFVVYSRYNNTKDIENALNDYFDEIFQKACREDRRKRLKKIA